MKKVKRISAVSLFLAFCLCGVFMVQAALAGTYKWQSTGIKSTLALYQLGDYYYAATASAVYKVDTGGNIVKTFTGLSDITSMSAPVNGSIVFVASGGALYQVNLDTSVKSALSTSPNITNIKKISRSSNGTYAIINDTACYCLNSSLIVTGSISYGSVTPIGVFATPDGGALLSGTNNGQYLVDKVSSTGSLTWIKYGLALPSNPTLPNGNYLLMNVNASGQNFGFSEISAANGSPVKTLASSTRFYNVIYAGTSSGSYQYFASFVDAGSVQNGRLDPSGAPTWQISGWSYNVMVAASDGSLVGGSFSMLASSYLKLNLQISTPILSLPTSSTAQISEPQASQANAGVTSSTAQTSSSKSDSASSDASTSDSSSESIFSPDQNDVGGSGGLNVWMIATIVLIAAGAIATFIFVVLPRIRTNKTHGPQNPHDPQGPGAPQWQQNPVEQQPPQEFNEYLGRQAQIQPPPPWPGDTQPPQPPQ